MAPSPLVKGPTDGRSGRSSPRPSSPAAARDDAPAGNASAGTQPRKLRAFGLPPLQAQVDELAEQRQEALRRSEAGHRRAARVLHTAEAALAAAGGAEAAVAGGGLGAAAAALRHELAEAQQRCAEAEALAARLESLAGALAGSAASASAFANDMEGAALGLGQKVSSLMQRVAQQVRRRRRARPRRAVRPLPLLPPCAAPRWRATCGAGPVAPSLAPPFSLAPPCLLSTHPGPLSRMTTSLSASRASASLRQRRWWRPRPPTRPWPSRRRRRRPA